MIDRSEVHFFRQTIPRMPFQTLPVPMHVNLRQTGRFPFIAGRFRVTLGGTTHDLEPRASIKVRPGRQHSYAPAGGASVVIVVLPNGALVASVILPRRLAVAAVGTGSVAWAAVTWWLLSLTQAGLPRCPATRRLVARLEAGSRHRTLRPQDG